MIRAFPSALLARVGRHGGTGLGAAPAPRLADAWAIWRRRIGMNGFVAILLVALAVGIKLLAINPARSEIAQSERQLDRLRRGDAGDRKMLAAPPGQDRVRPALSVEGTFPDQLDRLLQHAADQGLQLNDGLYTVTREAQGQVVCYQVSLPLQGTYPQVRRFLTALLKSEPGLALLDVQFHRVKISDPALDATVRLSYFMRPAP